MKFAVIGPDTIQDVSGIREVLSTYDITGLISGNQPGPDRIARRYAIDNHIPLALACVNYSTFGNNASHLLNIQIVGFAEQLIAFCDTETDILHHTLEYANRYGLPVDTYVQDANGQWALEIDHE